MKWIDEVRGTDSIREVARKARMNQGTLNRQINLDQIAFETVRAVARAYDLPVVPALIATGHLSREDVGYSDSVLTAASDDELVEEVAKRLRRNSVSSDYDLPISQLPSGITPLHPPADVGASQLDDLDAVARPTDPEPTDEQ